MNTICSSTRRKMLLVPGLKFIGTAAEKASVLSFVLDDARAEDVGKALDREGIAVRAGHHCAQPILRRFGLEATVRPSLAFYNTCADVDALVAALLRIQSGKGTGSESRHRFNRLKRSERPDICGPCSLCSRSSWRGVVVWTTAT